MTITWFDIALAFTFLVNGVAIHFWNQWRRGFSSRRKHGL
jgi:hypothetical protein